MAMVAIISLGFGVYQTYVYERTPEVVIEILSIGTVFSMDTRLPTPQLEYFSIGGKKFVNEELRLAVLRLRNAGRKGLSRSDFDETEQIGVMLSDGQIWNASVQDASSAYLKKHAVPIIKDRIVYFSPFIFDAGEWVTIEFLVTISTGKSLNLDTVGKIAGIPGRVPLVDLREELSKKPFWKQVFDADSWLVQLIRLPVYAIGLFLSLILVAATIAVTIAPFIAVNEWRDRRRRIALIDEYCLGRTLTDQDRLLIQRYRASDAQLMSTIAIIQRLDELEGSIPVGWRTQVSDRGGVKNTVDIGKFLRSRLTVSEDEAALVFRVESDDKVAIEPAFREALDRLVAFLKARLDRFDVANIAGFGQALLDDAPAHHLHHYRGDKPRGG
ncbi:MAG TPA: hypothetical protein DEH78_06245 [Solibacterales bacterium]|nr:hypothetical protein [Bryobacterales bacterium]